jgi:hypothetical protein
MYVYRLFGWAEHFHDTSRSPCPLLLLSFLDMGFMPLGFSFLMLGATSIVHAASLMSSLLSLTSIPPPLLSDSLVLAESGHAVGGFARRQWGVRVQRRHQRRRCFSCRHSHCRGHLQRRWRCQAPRIARRWRWGLDWRRWSEPRRKWPHWEPPPQQNESSEPWRARHVERLRNSATYQEVRRISLVGATIHEGRIK